MSTQNLIDGKFRLGANLAWLDGQYDHDFGKNQIMCIDTPAYTDSVHKANMVSYLQNMAKMGMNIVRLWVFERFEGLIFDNNGNVAGVDPTLINNLADVCSVAATNGLNLYLCLMDTWGIWQNNLPQKQNWLSTINGLITTQPKTNSFLNNAVLPLISDPRIKDKIFAIDVLNEPEGIDRANTMVDGTYPTDTQISNGQLVEYVKNCASSIKSKNVKVSCGFQKVSSVQNDPNGLEEYLDFFDLHSYSDNWNLPDYSDLGLEKPCIIGECGQQTPKWDDPTQQTAVTSFLNNSLNKGYAGCLVWNYNYKGFSYLTKDSNYLSLINSDGSQRPACSIISQFSKTI